MRNRRYQGWLAIVAQALLFISTLGSALGNPLSGTRSIGPTGDYSSITAALADIQAQTLDGPLVLELQPTYVSSVETFPIVFTNLTTTSVNTLTLRPQLGATNLLITTGIFNIKTVDLDGVQFVTIDGRPGGVGSNAGSGVGAASQLTIENTFESALTLGFATNNTIAYTTLKGASRFAAVVVLGRASRNTIDHCDIRDSASTPANGIRGGAASANDIISNCNIYNFFATDGGNQFGIVLNDGTDWTITGNSFYQTMGRVFGAAPCLVGGININLISPVTNKFVISSNSIGGSAPNASGSPWSVFGTPNDTRFIGIALNVGRTIPTSVQGNVIKNFSWLSRSSITTAPGLWGGITVSGGAVNIGAEAGNVIGDDSVHSISIMASGITNVSTGISSTGTNRVVIAHNVITSMRLSAGSTDEPSLIGIAVTSGVNIISNNLVGSSNAPSTLSVTNTYTAYGGMMDGISSSSSYDTVITGNLVAGLNNMHNGSGGGFVRGILASDGVNTVTGNTVRNLTASSYWGLGGASSTALGISVSSDQPGQTVSQNSVYSLTSTSFPGWTWVTGIHFSGSGGSSSISQNLVHSLEVYSTNIMSRLTAFSFTGGDFRAENNMARVGLAANGASTANDALVRGILDDSSSPGRNFYHNSVYIGGTHDSSTTNYTAAFYSNGSNACVDENNIFVNARSASGTSSHYAIYHNNPDLTGVTSDGNIFLASGIGGVLIGYSTNVYTTLAAWQSASGQDASSFSADPLFLNPTGDATSGDLHIPNDSPAMKAGLPIGVALDFDGNPRNPFTPSIGADDFNYPPIAPGYNLLSVLSLGEGTQTLGFVGIPGSAYALEIATNLSPPVLWQSLTTNNAGANGSLIFTNATGGSSVFYRTRFLH